MRTGLRTISTTAALAAFLLSTPPPAPAQTTGTPAEMVATYESLADGILALKRTEEELVRSILAATLAHGKATYERAVTAMDRPDRKAATAALEALAADVGQLATEGDNAVGAVRKRLLEGGHHHNAAGEAQGIYDEGYVIVTRAAKQKLLESARAIAGMAAKQDAVGEERPKSDALTMEWKKVQGVVGELLKASR